MAIVDSPFGLFAKLYDSQKETEMSLEDYLKSCARDPLAYASAAERMLAAIGEPEIVDTSHDPRLGRIEAAICNIRHSRRSDLRRQPGTGSKPIMFPCSHKALAHLCCDGDVPI